MRSRTDYDLKAPHEGAADLTRRILDNYRSSTQPVRQDYLEYLAQKSVGYADELEQRRGTQPTARDVEQSTRAVVDRVYAILEAYSLELNKRLRAYELYISSTAPSRLQEVLEYDRARQPLKSLAVYRTRFSSTRYSLVVRGVGHRVEFFLVPVDRVIGLSRAEAELSPLMTFESENGMTGLSWFVEGKPLNADRLERYSLLALEHLLDQTRGEVG